MASSALIACPRSIPEESHCAPRPRNGSLDSLPDELLARILAFLPFSDLWFARSVCRKWRSTLSNSPDFLKLLSLPRPPLLLRFHERMYNQSWAYDLDGKRWFHFPFLFCPGIATIAASAGGLVCLEQVSEGEYTLFVCNPLTKAWKRLPSIMAKPDHVLMGVGHESSCYVIVVLTLNRSMHVYDSRNGEWREKSEDVPWRMLAKNLRDATIANGVLYCLTTDHSIVAYDVEEGTWNHILSPMHLWFQEYTQLNMNRGKSYMFDWQGQLSVVTIDASHGGYGGSRNSVVYIDKYDPISGSWKEKGKLKDSMVCLAQFGSACMPWKGKSQLLLLNSRGGVCCLDFVSKTSNSIPENPHAGSKAFVTERSLWFLPSLSAIPNQGKACKKLIILSKRHHVLL